MKYIIIVCWLFTGVCFCFSGCKKTNDLAPDTNGTTGGGGGEPDYNPTDTTVSLEGGRITVDVPAGSMKEGTKISIASSSVNFVDTAHLLHQFELDPEGTKFTKPITIRLHYDSAWLRGNSPLNVGVAYRDDDDGKWYPSVNGEVDTINHTISVKSSHFSQWCIYTCFHLYMKAGGQVSEDYSSIIRMQPGDIGLLLVTMDEPPAWERNPDKSAEFGSPLVAPLLTPPIDPKESYSKSIAPDEWDVNGVVNGDEHVGKVMPVNGASQKLYQYLAPAEVPENNPVGVSATIHTQSHGDIVLIQDVEIMGKWKIMATDSMDLMVGGTQILASYHYDASFHVDDHNKVIFDGETHALQKFYPIQVAPPITSWVISDNNYTMFKTVSGEYDSKSNQLDLQVEIATDGGTVTQTVCGPPGCQTATTQNNLYSGDGGILNLQFTAESGSVIKKEETLYDADGVSAHNYRVFVLQRGSQ
jgi:hypothetical protein